MEICSRPISGTVSHRQTRLM